MPISLLALGTALPPNRFTQEQGARVAQVLCLDPRQSPLVPTLYRQTEISGRNLVIGEDVVRDVIAGTRESGSVFLPSGRPDDRGPTTSQRMRVYNEEAPQLALEASRQALTGANVEAKTVTHLVTVSCTGFAAPGVDIALIRGLGLPATTERVHVGFMGCHGALNGLRAARGLAAADPDAAVLLCAVELCSIHYHYGWDPKRVVANALFADGAGAAVVRANGPADAWKLTAHGACLFPDSAYAMTWGIGDHGFDMTLSTKVPNLIAQHLPRWLDGWLGRHGLTVDRVGSWAVHPGGPRVLNSVAEALGLEVAVTTHSHEVLTRHGNMSSPTILFILDRLRRAGAPLPCVALGFGPGLAVEAALFT
jgi:predicted naringenin-chalcone synthase